MVEVQYFGHSFFRIGFSNRNVLVDPFIGSDNSNADFKRLVKCAVTSKALRDIAIILVTHEHFDHFDKAAIEDIASRENCCVVAHDHILQELSIPGRAKFPIKMNQGLSLRGINIKALPAHHPNAFYPLSFLLVHGKESVFHAGDTDLMDGFAGIMAGVAMLPIGGTYTMDCVDAVRAVKTMKPKYAIPMHFGTWKMIQQDPSEFKQRIERSVLKTKPLLLRPGQRVRLRL
jgi:L-ascorbate metabolism protein UlaG (beta-lactamase superfamily)